MQARRTVLILSVMAFGLTQAAAGQKAYPLPPGPAAPAPQAITPAASTTATPQQSPIPAPQAAAPPTAASGQTVSQTVPAKDSKAAAREAKEEAKEEAKQKEKAKKAPYSGPTEIVVLPATPMLDENGKPALDPDGKPMFNPPVKQQRDKKGHPLFDEKGKPVFQTATDLGYDEKGKKIHSVKEKPPKLVPVHIARGTFSVDGVVGKAALNYDIPDLKYIYMYVPGMGTAVVSNTPFAGAKEEKGAFNDRILTVTVGEHKLELASENIFLGKKPESAYVKVDRDYALASVFPVVGYGTLRVAPYAWPGAKPQAVLEGTLAPPPLPKGLQPKLAVMPCPKGQVRAVAAKSADGQRVAMPPCVPIPVAKPVSIRQASAQSTAR